MEHPFNVAIELYREPELGLSWPASCYRERRDSLFGVNLYETLLLKTPITFARDYNVIEDSESEYSCSLGADGGYFVTSGIYTEAAEAFAQGLNLELVDGRKLRIMMDTARRKTVVSDIQLGSELIEIPPACPVCGGSMTKRIAQRGKHTGKEFWGCTKYPKCRGIHLLL